MQKLFFLVFSIQILVAQKVANLESFSPYTRLNDSTLIIHNENDIVTVWKNDTLRVYFMNNESMALSYFFDMNFKLNNFNDENFHKPIGNIVLPLKQKKWYVKPKSNKKRSEEFTYSFESGYFDAKDYLDSTYNLSEFLYKNNILKNYDLTIDISDKNNIKYTQTNKPINGRHDHYEFEVNAKLKFQLDSIFKKHPIMVLKFDSAKFKNIEFRTRYSDVENSFNYLQSRKIKFGENTYYVHDSLNNRTLFWPSFNLAIDSLLPNNLNSFFTFANVKTSNYKSAKYIYDLDNYVYLKKFYYDIVIDNKFYFIKNHIFTFYKGKKIPLYGYIDNNVHDFVSKSNPYIKNKYKQQSSSIKNKFGEFYSEKKYKRYLEKLQFYLNNPSELEKDFPEKVIKKRFREMDGEY